MSQLTQYKNDKATVWTIAGSDCTGGAGIQADTKTMHNLGLFVSTSSVIGLEVCSVITAVTAQNSFGVEQINAMSQDVILSQINALEQEKPASVIKIGLLANKQQVELIAQQITRFKNNWVIKPFIVYDPVAVASSGGNLTEDDILPTIKEKLLPLVDLLTPNGKEVQKLTGVFAFSWDCLTTAAEKILALGVGATIIKGGHIEIAENKSIDFCTDGKQEYWLSSDRINTQNSHGTGCTFASALAALLALGYALKDAFVIAKAYINQGLKISKQLGDNRALFKGAVCQGAWPNDINDYPEVLVAGSKLAESIGWTASKEDQKQEQHQGFCSDFASVETDKLGLYPVVDSIAWLERLLKTGVSTIQYREKKLTGDELELAIQQAIALGKQYKAKLFINDYWQLAIKHKAYGIHLGQEDIQTADLSAIKKAGVRLGISTHGHYELLKIKQYKPSYLAVGAIFPTKTKDMTGQIQGVDTLAHLVKLNPTIPMVAIGGITLEKAPSVLATNAGSIAVVTAITEADDPECAVQEFQQILQQQHLFQQQQLLQQRISRN
ncbi:bifunctional hydroxymethylpyrimidine kinase/phosphomethylpyrimidine kinase [Psychrosphaera saromensis]|uniref:Thiamine-phosphate synthase n=1 Tax=Psychrosphaera saromensis TaxID=716813 RepID=A0A2S7UVL3_9GAMM|nr:thiamine phosphate synthase [Psychrosphaera saromensis]PQJ53301.1 phosphomethylpyrimidine kinase [Psychrosphaera saromensis]GHB66558.1 bifunctional hydroxymethylpyrimidine kinase/phosphomethylpyrimidine kinase [Psychrosphaera saromensis]GLQ14931.1 bifunctional hydroxymethylpyrimidine kinase/phosphomethylpyrimidine kinase [Psychrosphaera saromensis]